MIDNKTHAITQQIYFNKNDDKILFKIEHDNYDYNENKNFLNDYINDELTLYNAKSYLIEL